MPAIKLVQTDWEPQQNFVMLSPVLLDEETEGGIIIPSVAYRKTGRGVVIKVGPDCTKDKFVIDRSECFYPQNTEYDIVVNETDDVHVYLVRESDIIMSREFQP